MQARRLDQVQRPEGAFPFAQAAAAYAAQTAAAPPPPVRPAESRNDPGRRPDRPVEAGRTLAGEDSGASRRRSSGAGFSLPQAGRGLAPGSGFAAQSLAQQGWPAVQGDASSGPNPVQVKQGAGAYAATQRAVTPPARVYSNQEVIPPLPVLQSGHALDLVV
ncbi:MAG: hypothetical protein K2Q10_05805 [Rhodospirillales bacterium]|nr:hypothetical protein [Rhodospirillales bacterium]